MRTRTIALSILIFVSPSFIHAAARPFLGASSSWVNAPGTQQNPNQPAKATLPHQALYLALRDFNDENPKSREALTQALADANINECLWCEPDSIAHEVRYPYHETAVHKAMTARTTALLYTVLKLGADPNTQPPCIGESALSMYCGAPDTLDKARMLLMHGANPNEIIRSVSCSIDEPLRMHNGLSLLGRCLKSHDYEWASLLLEFNADPTLSGPNSTFSPLSLAVCAGNDVNAHTARVVEALLNVRDEQGNRRVRGDIPLALRLAEAFAADAALNPACRGTYAHICDLLRAVNAEPQADAAAAHADAAGSDTDDALPTYDDAIAEAQEAGNNGADDAARQADSCWGRVKYLFFGN